MLSATTRPWYMATWVNRATPVTSPSAHRPSPARHRPSTAIPPRPVSVPPAASRPSPAVAGWRPAPRITTSVSTWLPSSRVTTGVAPVRPARRRGVLAVDQPAGPLDDGDLRAHPGIELAEFDADRAAADHQQ